MKKVIVLILGIIILSALWTKNPSALKTNFNQSKKVIDNFIKNPSVETVKNTLNLDKFKEKLKMASLQLSQLQEDPAKVEIELRNWAQSFGEIELSQLKEISFNRQVDQDLRFLAVTLLSWSKNSSAGSLLSNIAGSSYDQILNPGRLGDFEKILRLRAAEGLGELSISLEEKKDLAKQVLAKTPYSEVADRVHRLQWSLDGAAPSPEKQDQEALEKLLSKEED